MLSFPSPYIVFFYPFDPHGGNIFEIKGEEEGPGLNSNFELEQMQIYYSTTRMDK